MFKRVDKATGKRDRADQLKRKTGDDTAISIDQLADESSSSESDTDSDSSASSSDDGKRKGVKGRQASKRVRSDTESVAESDAESYVDDKTEDSDEEEFQQTQAGSAHEGPAVTIAEALRDPIYIPTTGDKKHGVMASKCILCDKATLKSAHLVEEHVKSKSHLRRMERFNLYVTEQMSDTERRTIDARDAVEDMDAWREAKALEEKKVAAIQKVAKKKRNLREMRKAKKDVKRQKKSEKSEKSGTRGKLPAVEDPALKKERKKLKYGDKKALKKSTTNAVPLP